MIMFGSFLPSLLVGFRTTNFTRTSEPTLSWNQLHSLTPIWVAATQVQSFFQSVNDTNSSRISCNL
jgi:hypothetical protein